MPFAHVRSCRPGRALTKQRVRSGERWGDFSANLSLRCATDMETTLSEAITENTINAFAYATVQFAVSIVLTFLTVRLAKLSFGDKIAVWWNYYDIIVHFTLVSVVSVYHNKFVANSQSG